jgi:hypothetical protein
MLTTAKAAAVGADMLLHLVDTTVHDSSGGWPERSLASCDAGPFRISVPVHGCVHAHRMPVALEVGTPGHLSATPDGLQTVA